MTNAVDRVYDAKAAIARDLDVIRDRLGRPLAPETLDRHDPTQRQVLALEHVTRQFEAGRCAGTDPAAYLHLVDQHLTPLEHDRPWARRGSIPSTARRHVVHLERDQQHGRPDALEPLTELLARQAAKARAAAAYAAWAELNGVGLAGDGRDGDLVTDLLASDMPGPRPVVIVSRTVDQDGTVIERTTQAELWDADEYPGGDVA